MIIFAGKDNQKTVSVCPGFYHGKPWLFITVSPGFRIAGSTSFFIAGSTSFFIERANIATGCGVWSVSCWFSWAS